MTIFLIDDEDALCRMLAARAWTEHHVSISDKELQELMRKLNEEATSKRLLDTLDEIKKNRCKTGRSK